MDKIQEDLSTIIADYKFGNIDMEEAIKEILQSLQSSTVTDKQVISDEEKYKTALEKIIAVQNDDNYFLMPPLDMLFTITEIAKNALSKSKAINY